MNLYIDSEDPFNGDLTGKVFYQTGALYNNCAGAVGSQLPHHPELSRFYRPSLIPPPHKIVAFREQMELEEAGK